MLHCSAQHSPVQELSSFSHGDTESHADLQANSKRIDDAHAQLKLSQLQLARANAALASGQDENRLGNARCEAAEATQQALLRTVREKAAAFDELFEQLQGGQDALQQQALRLQFASATHGVMCAASCLCGNWAGGVMCAAIGLCGNWAGGAMCVASCLCANWATLCASFCATPSTFAGDRLRFCSALSASTSGRQKSSASTVQTPGPCATSASSRPCATSASPSVVDAQQLREMGRLKDERALLLSRVAAVQEECEGQVATACARLQLTAARTEFLRACVLLQ